ncbi:M81 family metallopeptidase [Frigidibacter sp. ROC022]|uniref:M81 family metallopeptidase n=1 Tax=Frigidibacter sp. ROC022 TaxID=2971796 RepID=UPI00215B4F15|nr:M81 family metallopeptidase [Frigidibacter sp. ROC022]MCR8726046.1 M81 family metallopeptidase [Frigidibacter sp. ROC022]
MRIALIHISQETNDFNPALTRLSDYRSFGILEGEEMLDKLSGHGEVGGFLEVMRAKAPNCEIVPIFRAFTVAGGRIDRESFEFFERKIRDGLAAAGRIDGLMLQLHGACASVVTDDVEGAQAALCREILGPDIPIALALDHHANITGRIVDSVDAIVGHRTQPHDLMDTGRIGAEMILKILVEKVRPVMAWRKIPLVTHQEQFLTSQGPMKTWFDRARALEGDPNVLQVANFPMQPWLDVAEGGWATVVVTDGDPALAERLADEMAEMAWEMRDDFLVREAVPVDTALRAADAEPEGLVVLSDTGDTVFGGAAGDSNVILEAALRLGVTGPVLIPMISKAAVAILSEAGEGAEVTLPLGGCTAKEFFTPLTVTGVVRKVADGSNVTLSNYFHQSAVNMGKVVIFETGPVTLMITELRGVAGNVPDAYRAFGVEPRDYKMAVLKTASNFQFFASITSRLIRADTRGPGQSDVYTLPWKRLPRPIHPLDKVTDWRGAHPVNRRTTREAGR